MKICDVSIFKWINILAFITYFDYNISYVQYCVYAIITFEGQHLKFFLYSFDGLFQILLVFDRFIYFDL